VVRLTLKQRQVSRSALRACRRVGLYVGLDLNLAAFRARRSIELVEACNASCPLAPGDFGTCLVTFRERLRGGLEEYGYEPLISLQLLCAVRRSNGDLVDWTWGDWCDHLARRI